MPDATMMPLEPAKPPDRRKLRTDGGTQSRANVSEANIASLTEWLRDNRGRDLDAVVGFRPPGEGIVWLAHGHQRHEAYRRAGRSHLPVEVRPGTLDDARAYSSSCNQKGTLPRTPADKRRAVGMMLDVIDAAPGKLFQGKLWSNGMVAAHCGVSESLVRAVKKEREGRNLVSNEFPPDEVDEDEDEGEGDARHRAEDEAVTFDDPDDAPKLERQSLSTADKLLRHAEAVAGEQGRALEVVLAEALARAELTNARSKRAEELERAANKLDRQVEHLGRLRERPKAEALAERLACARAAIDRRRAAQAARMGKAVDEPPPAP